MYCICECFGLTVQSIGDAPVMLSCGQVVHGPPHIAAYFSALRVGLLCVAVVVVVVVVVVVLLLLLLVLLVLVLVVGAASAPGTTGRAAAVPDVPHGAGAAVEVAQARLTVYGAPGAGSSVPLRVQHEDDLLQLAVLPRHAVLVDLQLLQLHRVGAHLLPHGGGRVAAEALPLAGQLLALLPVVVQEAAELPQLVVVVLELLVDLLQAPDLVQVHLEPPVDVLHQVAVVHHQVQLLAVHPAQPADQVLSAAPRQLLVRQLAQVLIPVSLERALSHDDDDDDDGDTGDSRGSTVLCFCRSFLQRPHRSDAISPSCGIYA